MREPSMRPPAPDGSAPGAAHPNRLRVQAHRSAPWRLLLILLWLAAALSARAAGPEPDFELAPVDGGDFVRLSALPPRPTLVNFWRADCPPCVHELPMLLGQAERLRFRLVTVALQSLMETREFWPKTPGRPAVHLALLGPSNPTGLLRRFGNRSGAIPQTVWLRPDGTRCAGWIGEVPLQWIEDGFRQCR